MAKLQKGKDFTTGSPFSGADLNSLVDAATILPGAITEQSAVTPAGADTVMVYSAAATALGKCTVTQLFAAQSSDAAAGTPSIRTLGTGAQQAAPGNSTGLSASVAGVRKSTSTASTDVAATAKDFAYASVNITSLTNIDWDAGDVFVDTLLASNKTYTFSNLRDGRVIVIKINQNSKTVAFPVGWLLLGTANTAGWNIYSLSYGPGAAIAAVAS